MPSKKSLDSLDYKPANIQFVTNHPGVEKCVFRNAVDAQRVGKHRAHCIHSREVLVFIGRLTEESGGFTPRNGTQERVWYRVATGFAAYKARLYIHTMAIHSALQNHHAFPAIEAIGVGRKQTRAVSL